MWAGRVFLAAAGVAEPLWAGRVFLAAAGLAEPLRVALAANATAAVRGGTASSGGP